ncbi:MAG: hypothetical protein WD098_04940 [Balneolales bacterium]
MRHRFFSGLYLSAYSSQNLSISLISHARNVRTFRENEISNHGHRPSHLSAPSAQCSALKSRDLRSSAMAVMFEPTACPARWPQDGIRSRASSNWLDFWVPLHQGKGTKLKETIS